MEVSFNAPCVFGLKDREEIIRRANIVYVLKEMVFSERIGVHGGHCVWQPTQNCDLRMKLKLRIKWREKLSALGLLCSLSSKITVS